MALFHHPKPPPPRVILLTYATLLLLISPAHSITCSSQKFSNNLYINCTDLPTLKASLYWNHVAKTSSLSIAFVAPPSKPDGWIAWAINPKGTGMAGSQALVAFKDSKGSMTLKTYNISSYSSIVEGNRVLNSRAEYSAGTMKIHATVKLPKTMKEFNHVWQVGGAVVDGMPVKHEFQPENLNAKGKLQLEVTEKAPTSNSIARSPAIAPVSSPNPSYGSRNSAMYVLFMVIIGALISN
ncbi:cytochrome b561 and DOMON domain-containing protein At4g12980-like [Bidens hawaiensis]|uniref:cytochrome b561 and DOMON domain-containing protein At4g12980-like n=1 Tax=Bidens hawaiensis TaxID=980011 RepID=UPI004049EBD5